MRRSSRNKAKRELHIPSSTANTECRVDFDRYLAETTVRGRHARVTRAAGRGVRRVERPRSRGQALLIIALMMTVLILFVGLGVDVGNMMGKRAKLQSAVDASALSAAQLLTGTIVTTTIQTKAYQMLQANGVPTTTLSFKSVTVNSQLRQVSVRAVQRVDTFFMRIVPMWRTVEVSADATADLNAFAELNVKPYGIPGVVNELQLQTWGPWSWRQGGDVYSPVYDPAGGATFPNDEHGNQPYGYLFRIDVPSNFTDDQLVVQIFDPDTYNNPVDMAAPTNYVPPPYSTVGPPPTNTPAAYDSIYFNCGGSCSASCTANCTESINPALKLNGYTRGDWVQAPWSTGRAAVWRVDEYRMLNNQGAIGPPGGDDYDIRWPTETNFTLWHFDPRITSAFGKPEDMSDQPGRGPVTGAFTYTARYQTDGRSPANYTDLAWFEPWAPIKLIDPSCSGYRGNDCFERESNGNFYFYLYVQTSNGSSENDYDLRVGPRAVNYAAGYDCKSLGGWASSHSVCYSNEQFYRQSRTNPSLPDWNTGGAQILAKRALPLNLATGAAFPMLYTQVSKNAAGQTLAIRHFDQDCSSGCTTPASHFQMQYCVEVGTTNLCASGNCEPCNQLLSPNCFGNVSDAYRGPNNGWVCSGCPDPEQVNIPSEGTSGYQDFFGPNGECETSWLRLEQNLSYSNDTTVWEMPYRRPRLIK